MGLSVCENGFAIFKKLFKMLFGVRNQSIKFWELIKSGIKDHVAINNKAYVNLMTREFIPNVQWQKDAQLHTH